MIVEDSILLLQYSTPRRAPEKPDLRPRTEYRGRATHSPQETTRTGEARLHCEQAGRGIGRVGYVHSPIPPFPVECGEPELPAGRTERRA